MHSRAHSVQNTDWNSARMKKKYHQSNSHTEGNSSLPPPSPYHIFHIVDVSPLHYRKWSDFPGCSHELTNRNSGEKNSFYSFYTISIHEYLVLVTAYSLWIQFCHLDVPKTNLVESEWSVFRKITLVNIGTSLVRKLVMESLNFQRISPKNKIQRRFLIIIHT